MIEAFFEISMWSYYILVQCIYKCLTIKIFYKIYSLCLQTNFKPVFFYETFEYRQTKYIEGFGTLAEALVTSHPLVPPTSGRLTRSEFIGLPFKQTRRSINDLTSIKFNIVAIKNIGPFTASSKSLHIIKPNPPNRQKI